MWILWSKIFRILAVYQTYWWNGDKDVCYD